MTEEERSRLEGLDTALRSDNVREHIRSVVVRVHEQLARRKDALMSWEPFPLEFSQRHYRLRFDLRGYLFCARARTQARKASEQSSTHDVVRRQR
jgi:hypothetical protein